MYLAVNSGTYYNTVTLVTTVVNFPFSRGQAVGLLTGMVGLSAAIYSQMYTAFIAPNRADFLLILSLGPSLSAVGVMGWLKARPLGKLVCTYVYVYMGVYTHEDTHDDTYGDESNR